MVIYIGSDHRGFKLKETIKEHLNKKGYNFKDVGNYKYDKNDDYPDFAKKAVEKAVNENDSIAIVICGSGVGVDIVANKIKGARSALCFNVKQAIASRVDDDANVLALPADFLKGDEALEIVDAWLGAKFSGDERFLRRINKIKEIENI